MKRVEKLRAYMQSEGLDTFFVFSAENRRYLTGFTGTNGIVIIRPDRCVLMTDSRYTEQAEAQAKGFEISTYNLSPYPYVNKMLSELGARRIGYESKLLSDAQARAFAAMNPAFCWVPTEDVLLRIRRVKDENEIECIRRACAIADAALQEVLPRVRPGVSEKEIQIELEYAMRRRGHETPQPSMIVASGVRSSMPHGVASDKKLESGDFITIDFGAVVGGYHSDMTRTLWLGQPRPELVHLFEVVDESMQAAYAAIRVGVDCETVERAHRDVFRKYGLEQYALRGLGHGVGLQIHEWPQVIMHNSEEILAANMVFTVEPGLYIPGLGGVRTEDTVLLRDSGMEILTLTPKKIIIDL